MTNLKHQKIAVVNFSGNVGKSTIARHLLMPRMPDAVTITVETINADGTGDVTFRGSEFGVLQEELFLEDSAIIDVGASNIEQFLSMMRKYRGSQNDFDLFLVPTVASQKQQKDTIECVNALNALGIRPEKIQIIFNMVESGENVANTFSSIFDFAEVTKKCRVNERAAIETNEVFARLRGTTESIQSILDETTDYKEKIRNTSDTEMKLQYAARLSTQRLAQGVQENLNQVFQAVFG